MPDANGQSPFPAGSGTPEDPWVIETPDQLRAIERFPDASFVLGNNLDLGGAQGQLWTPLFSCPPEAPRCEAPRVGFAGDLDGDGYFIHNMSIAGEANFVGLMGLVAGGRISNLNFEACQVSGGARVGLIAGELSTGPTRLSLITTVEAGEVEVAGIDEVGGLVGHISHRGLGIFNSLLIGEVSGTNWVGGLVGELSGQVARADFVGTVEARGTAVGGAVGSQNPGSVVEMVTVLSPLGVHGLELVGGITGLCTGGVLTDVASEAEVRGDSLVGGLTGEAWSGCRITRGLHLGAATVGEDLCGGLAGRLDNARIADSFSLAPVIGAEGTTRGAVVGHLSADSDLEAVRYDGELTGVLTCAGSPARPNPNCTREHLDSFTSAFWYDPSNPLLAPLVQTGTWAFFANRFPLPRTAAERRGLEPLP